MIYDITISVSITLTGHNLVLEDITRDIGIEPSRTWQEGQPIGKSALVRDCDGWVYSLEPQSTSELESVIINLLNTLQPISHQIISVSKKFCLEMELTCVIYTESTMPVLNITAATLGQISRLDATLDIDIIVAN